MYNNMCACVKVCVRYQPHNAKSAMHTHTRLCTLACLFGREGTACSCLQRKWLTGGRDNRKKR